MREIKFRVWDNLDKTMDSAENTTYIENNRPSEFNEFVFMQYTGLKDKNDVDIYEGDYMLDSHSGSHAEVKFIKGAFIVEFDNEIQDLYDWTCECVIGNIYQNKKVNKGIICK